MTTTLVLGGTGKTGSRIAARLRDLGTNVRIGSRTSEVPFDWDDDTTWTPALDDVDSAYVCYYPDVSFPGAVRAKAATRLPVLPVPPSTSVVVMPASQLARGETLHA